MKTDLMDVAFAFMASGLGFFLFSAGVGVLSLVFRC